MAEPDEKLGDIFPDNYKQGYVDRQLVPGQVVYLHCDFTTPPKDKYLVVACIKPEVLLLVINSSIPPFVAKRQDLCKCQVQVNVSDHPFLRHDSYVNCAEVIRESEQPNMRRQLVKKVGRIKGKVSPIARRKILNAVRQARTLSRADKEAIRDALTQQP